MDKSRPTVAILLAAFALTPSAATGREQTAGPVLNPPPKIVSLHRPRPDWRVITTIVLAIRPTTDPRKVVFRHSAAGKGVLGCDTENDAHETTPALRTSVECSYEPAVGFSGTDSFVYDAKFEGGQFSEPATVEIEVRERGLRWEFKTAGSTITSDSPDPDALKEIPSILGGTSQDFLFALNWQTLGPRNHVQDNARARAPVAGGVLRMANLAASPGIASRTANVVLETGVQSEAVASTVADVGRSATQPRSSESEASTPAEEAVARRNLVLRGEFNYNAAFRADGEAAFVEFGAVGKGSFSTVLNSNESFVEAAGRVLQIVPKDRSAFRVEGGVRLAIKQSHELGDTAILTAGGQIEHPSNIENHFLLEFTTRFDSSVSDLATDSTDGDSRRRWAFRAEFSPHIRGLPGHELALLGAEVSRAWSGGPPAVKLIYGVNLSATKGIFSTR